MNLRISWGGPYVKGQKWNWRTVRARRLNPYFAMHRNDGAVSWIVTHIPSGFAAAYGVADLAEARRIASALLATYGAKAWRFKDPEKARAIKGALTVIAAARVTKLKSAAGA